MTDTAPTRVTRRETVEVPQKKLVLDDTSTGKLPKGVTPSVLNNEHWTAQNKAPVTVTNFAKGQDTQHLLILGDGQTTLQHGTKIMNQGGADLLLIANTLYHYVNISGIWYQV